MQVANVSAFERVPEEPHALFALTVTLPAAAPQLAVIAVVPCPDAMVHPAGTVQVKVFVPCASVLNATPTWLGQTEAGPVMLAGVDGRRVKEALRTVEPPQLFKAVTLNVPVVKVLGTFKRIWLPLLNTMLHPVGTDQL